MKNIFFLLLFTISLLSNAQQNNEIDDNRIKILVNKSNNKTITKDEAAELRKYITKIQTKGEASIEKKQDTVNGLIDLNKALDLSIKINDTMVEAGIRSYRGRILDRLRKYDEAGKDFRMVIFIHKKNKFYSSLAFIQHNYSVLLSRENKLDSALYYSLAASEYWNKLGDTSSILAMNNQLINIYHKLKKDNLAIEIQKKNTSYAQKKNIYWEYLLNFYYISYKLYYDIQQYKLSIEYQKLYDDKIEELRKRKIYKRSVYE